MLKNIWYHLLELVYPRKCTFCGTVLQKEETDLCSHCRSALPEFEEAERQLQFVAQCITAFHYTGVVRASILRYKFKGKQTYADGYGRLLAMRISRQLCEPVEWITWVPVSKQRLRERGYDQAQLLAQAVGKEMGLPVFCTLEKTLDNHAQSSLASAEARRANVLGAYQAVKPELWRGKRLLLIDDVVTTGATLSECSRVLLTAGAAHVVAATMAAAPNKKKQRVESI